LRPAAKAPSLMARKAAVRLFTLPRYPNPHVAIKRWQAFSRKDAIHAETDLTFDEVASDRTAAPAVAVAQTDVR
jgi:hypothetical protein